MAAHSLQQLFGGVTLTYINIPSKTLAVNPNKVATQGLQWFFGGVALTYINIPNSPTCQSRYNNHSQSTAALLGCGLNLHYTQQLHLSIKIIITTHGLQQLRGAWPRLVEHGFGQVGLESHQVVVSHVANEDLVLLTRWALTEDEALDEPGVSHL